jgi:phenylacetate-CoA ligase
MNFYGLSEMCGPGVAAECLVARSGLHVQEDHFLVEVIDPDSGAAVPAGGEGELVLTTLTKEALPLIRYRTGDLVSITSDPCECGRTTIRLMQLRGRRDDMLIVRGVNVFPSAVRDVVSTFLPQVSGHILIRPRGAGTQQQPPLPLSVELADGAAPDLALAAAIRERLRNVLVVQTEVELVGFGSLGRSEYKSKLVER